MGNAFIHKLVPFQYNDKTITVPVFAFRLFYRPKAKKFR